MPGYSAISYSEIDLAILDTAQMAQADRFAIDAGTPGIVLMERAGLAVTEAVCRRLGAAGAVSVACGPGNNGGDGLVAARILRERGVPVRVGLLGDKAALRGDAALALQRWDGPIEALDALLAGPGELVVDALFGAGLSRPLEGEAARAVAAMNAAGCPIVAVDVPSGLSGDTGQAEGTVVRATETVTFFRLKPGHLLQPGRDLCGRVELADIGIPPEALDALGLRTFRTGPALWRGAWPHHGSQTHKYARGAVAIVAGGVEGVGAPRLGARAALRIGAGLATLFCAPGALVTHAARGPDALMQRALAGADALLPVLADRRVSAVLAGPALGLDDRARDLVDALVRCDRPAVLDADALTLLAKEPGGASTCLAARVAPAVLTPHEGEFRRLFGAVPAIEQERSKLERARRAAASCQAVLVYKGADTVIAAPDGRAAINATGSPALATAGAGDVLAGMIAGLLAQGMPAFEAAAAAVWLHGRVGEKLGFGLIADDLVEALPASLPEAAGD